MAWNKGESGNPTGTAKDKIFRQALMMELKSKGEALPELRKIARRIIDTAMGEVKIRKGQTKANYTPEFATTVIIERLDGKLAQGISGADGEGPLEIVVKKMFPPGDPTE